MSRSVYDYLGTKPVINARGIYTDLGGSKLSAAVWSAMGEANRDFADLPDLLDSSGQMIARLMETEAARVTPGASAAIVLACAACMTGTDGAKLEQLPDTTGMRNSVLIQSRHRYKYDRMVRISGARLMEVGDGRGTDADQFRNAIGPSTAAVLFPGHLDGVSGTLPLPEVVALAHASSVPVLVDAAFLNYPIDLMLSFTRAGADLAIFSAKYFGGPNAGGFVCGSSDLIAAIAAADFTRFESGQHLIPGRPFKLDRQLIVAVTLALHEWMSMDHGERFRRYAARVGAIVDELAGLPFVEAVPMGFTMQEELVAEPVNCLLVRLGSEALVAKVDAGLRGGSPAVYTHPRGDALIVDVEVVDDDEARLIGRRLREEFTKSVESSALTDVLPGRR
jgi:L-seryl-tRNA(Ser) seleniumtransferase